MEVDEASADGVIHVPKDPDNRVVPLAAIAIIGFVVGYFVADDSSEIRKLRSELQQLSHAPTSRPARASVPWRKEKAGTPASLSRSRSASNDRLAELGITPDDLEAAKALDRRRDDGEYILRSEKPIDRKIQEHDISRIVARKAANTAGEYDRILLQLGLQPESVEKTKIHLTKIHQASLEAEVAIQELMEARLEYKKKLQSSLTVENYSRYRQYEELKPALREFEDLKSFLARSNVSVDPRYEQNLLSLIRDSQAYTKASWDGPYDGLPQPAIGAENVVKWIEQQRDQIIERSNDVIAKTTLAGLPNDYTKLLEEYYSARILEKQREIEAHRNPVRRAPVIPNPEKLRGSAQ